MVTMYFHCPEGICGYDRATKYGWWGPAKIVVEA